MPAAAATTMPAPPTVGTRAPGLALPTTDGQPWSLHEAVKNGPVVVCFMPGAFTVPCTKEMCAFTANWAEYATLKAQVVGVTVDSKHAQLAWAAKEGIKIPLVSDFEKKAIHAWGLGWNSSWGVTSRRATFVVDRTGTVRYANVQANAGEEPPYADIRKAVAALK